ncbi:TetR/AcrR family transcriptional regulator [Thermithiobacillus plumbiphilus]|uniref:TetR/AcrR family transcriptional regulator n=1 Tax=Thermithiobacillus plumbiphilus TaxID=1729899 RepID=A0ABU9D8D6_9PROT
MQKTITRPQGSARQHVLESALSLFTEQGYFNTSVHDIARASTVSIGSIYHHFQDKEGIARALHHSLLDEMESVLTGIVDRHENTHDRSRAIVELLFELALDSPHKMAFMLSAKHREFMPDEPPVCSSRPFGIMREIVTEGIRNGELYPNDPLVAATCLFGGPIRMVNLHLDGILPKPLSHYLEEVWRCAWRGVSR